MKQFCQNKKLLIVYQPWRKQEEGLSYPIKLSLEKYGMQVDMLDICFPPAFKNNYLPDKLINIFRRLVFKDSSYYFKAEKRHYQKFYLQKLKTHPRKDYDYILVIRPDEYKPYFFKTLTQYGTKMCGYIWDGIHDDWGTDLKNSAKYFQNIFCFDPYDIEKHKDIQLKFATNFYIDNLVNRSENLPKYLFSYIGGIGSKDANRRDFLIQKNFSDYLQKSEIIIQCDLGYINPENELHNENLQYQNEYLPYIQVLEKEKNAEIIIDICKPHHKGLSFRAFESLFFGKKLITNNADVVNYDFYHPENILIVDFNNPAIEKVKQFMKLPYHPIDENIVKKYSVENWIKYILNLEGNIPITYGK